MSSRISRGRIAKAPGYGLIISNEAWLMVEDITCLTLQRDGREELGNDKDQFCEILRSTYQEIFPLVRCCNLTY